MENNANLFQQKHFWWASHILKKLGYKDLDSFENVIFKSLKSFITLDIPYYENIHADIHPATHKKDYRLSKFACYILVLYSDPKKDAVIKAKQQIGKKIGFTIKDLIDLERAGIREELAEANKWLSSLAKYSGVKDFSKFIDSGYEGLYAMPKWQLTDKRGQKRDANIQNLMNRAELAINLLRVTLTEDYIRSHGIKGQNNLEQVHENVGKELRTMIKKVSGNYPEQFNSIDDIDKVKKKFKEQYRHHAT